MNTGAPSAVDVVTVTNPGIARRGRRIVAVEPSLAIFLAVALAASPPKLATTRSQKRKPFAFTTTSLSGSEPLRVATSGVASEIVAMLRFTDRGTVTLRPPPARVITPLHGANGWAVI